MSGKFEEDIEAFIVDELHGGDKPGDLNSDTRLVEEGLLDSLGIFEMVTWIESKLGIEIPAEEVTLENFRTIVHIDMFMGNVSVGR